MSYQSLVDFSGWTFVAQILNLLIQMLLFKKFLFQPIRKILEKRQQEVDSIYAEADKAKLEAQTAKESLQLELRDAGKTAQTITENAAAAARKTSDEIIRQAQTDAQTLLEKAQSQIELERRRSADSLKGEVSSLAVELAGKLVEKELDEKQHQVLIDRFIDELGEDHA